MNAIAPNGGGGSPEIAISILEDLKAASVWVLWKSNPNIDPAKKPKKVPYYASGQRRSGELDSPEDRAQLVTHAVAAKACERAAPGTYAGLGYALGPDGRGGFWQGIDLDSIEANGLADIANSWVRGECKGWGYIEASPSRTGAHIVGYGREFQTLGSDTTGIEAYCRARFFTFTGLGAVNDSPCRVIDLAGFVEQVLVTRHGGGESSRAKQSHVEVVSVDAKTITELRSALFYMRSDDRALWVAMGHALKELGEIGRSLWMDWSATSEKFDAKDAARTWESFAGQRTGYQAVFAEAQRQDWVNPASNSAAITPAVHLSGTVFPDTAKTFSLEFAMITDTATLKLDYLVDPWLPRRCVVGFFGRGSTAKSSFLASIAAAVSSNASTLWISVEEPDEWVKVRHIRCGGADKTLAIVKAIETKRDKQGRVVASSFNVLTDLEPAIEQAGAAFDREQRPPLRLVVLDTAVGLTHWGKGESPNDDAAVKKLLAHLQAWAERYDLTIALIGHANKGTHDHLADTVMGAAAWTNSPRLSFIHAADRREDYSYVVRVAKSNFDTFGAPYRTEPVHTLYARQNGPDTVLVKAVPGTIVWGSLDSLDMFREATRVPRDDASNGDGPILAAPKKP